MSVRANVATVFCILVSLLTVAIVWGCRHDIVDVNGCGNYPPPGTCVLINWAELDYGCCRICQHQCLKKEWYDCNGDGVADCEYDLWFKSFDGLCCLDGPPNP